MIIGIFLIFCKNLACFSILCCGDTANGANGLSGVSPQRLLVPIPGVLQLPPGATQAVPKGLDWEALDDTPVSYIIWYKAPYSDGGEAVLPKGERLLIDRHARDRPIYTGCEALRHAEMESVLIPEHTRKSRKYNGYGLGIRTAVLNRCCRLVESA